MTKNDLKGYMEKQQQRKPLNCKKKGLKLPQYPGLTIRRINFL